ncbi:hypothetical protein EJ03DRAFT_122097 [Teratosphaeria nubilosa]|uniref:Uncharacterized protein n=1 Tax=Teratosphaeria nubilosa TaxID=161662 RepID=A0A6G1L699_9PEZI|nr:hypothetical protein EJ03DRAFT_122097 [Teratosphaeria nubilosa]
MAFVVQARSSTARETQESCMSQRSTLVRMRMQIEQIEGGVDTQLHHRLAVSTIRSTFHRIIKYSVMMQCPQANGYHNSIFSISPRRRSLIFSSIAFPCYAYITPPPETLNTDQPCDDASSELAPSNAYYSVEYTLPVLRQYAPSSFADHTS